MNTVLALDVNGIPRHWISLEQAISYHATDSVAWSMGDHVVVYHGGHQRSGVQSRLMTRSIIAIRGNGFDMARRNRVGLHNRTLFGRDLHICAYCGRYFENHRDLSRDHILPCSRGGLNTWTNCVTACRDCNSYKGNRTLKEAGMELLYLPYEPSYQESLLLQNRNILADQSEYLKSTLPKNSRLHKLEIIPVLR